jgi:hypothetical protein
MMDIPVGGYSADFQGRLVVGDLSYPLARLDSQELGLAQPIDLPPVNAEIVLVVDGREYRRPVSLHEGSSASSLEIPYRPLE